MKQLQLLLLILLLMVSCKKDQHNDSHSITKLSQPTTDACADYIQQNKQQNLNINILLDLSDRIEKEGQLEKDLAYIQSLSKIFNAHVEKKRLVLLYDKIEVFFEPQPKGNDINELTKQLKVAYVKGVSKNEWLPKTATLYTDIPKQLYTLTQERSVQEGYPGSDTWRFFKEHVKDYCIEDCYRNVLVILTDGFMYHENSKISDGKGKYSYLTPKLLKELGLNTYNWKDKVASKGYGFIPATQGLEDLEVLVIGVSGDLKKNPHTNDIITAFWEEWFTAMGVQKYKIKDAGNPADIEKVIAEFI